MKNFPHQFNELSKFFRALGIINDFANNNKYLTDEDFGEQLTRNGIYTYRDKGLTIDEFLVQEQKKPISNRGYLTVARDIRRFFELLGFISVLSDKSVKLTPYGTQILRTRSENILTELWKNSLLQLGLEGRDGEISHPYKILLKIVKNFPGIETSKLMLALEAENDSEEEFERIANLIPKSLSQIIQDINTTPTMAANAVKVLPGIAEQLNDIKRIDNKAFPIGEVLITEDDITTEEHFTQRRTFENFRNTDSTKIAQNPNINIIPSVSIDLSDAIRIRQKRLIEHQRIVRLLAAINERCGFQLYEGKFDCLAVKNQIALLYEIKTIANTFSDEEKQTVKGVGQLKYYKYSIVFRQMMLENIKEILVFSQKPTMPIIEFCLSEKILVIWEKEKSFNLFNNITNNEEPFDPIKLLNN